MKIDGTIISGVLRGSMFVEIVHPRLVGLLGFQPFKGTLNVKLARPVDIRFYATKTIEHKIMDGTRHIDAYLAPITLSFKEHDVNCWAMHQAKGVYGNDVIEVVYQESLRDALSLKDGDGVAITFSPKPAKKKKLLPGASILKRLYGKERQLMKS